jgi:hypothetical protein
MAAAARQSNRAFVSVRKSFEEKTSDALTLKESFASTYINLKRTQHIDREGKFKVFKQCLQLRAFPRS